MIDFTFPPDVEHMRQRVREFMTTVVKPAEGGALPSTDEIVARYAERSTRDLSAIQWYAVMACFKLGIVLEGTHARAFAGKAPKPTGDLLHAITLGLFERALAIIGGD